MAVLLTADGPETEIEDTSGLFPTDAPVYARPKPKNNGAKVAALVGIPVALLAVGGIVYATSGNHMDAAKTAPAPAPLAQASMPTPVVTPPPADQTAMAPTPVTTPAPMPAAVAKPPPVRVASAEPRPAARRATERAAVSAPSAGDNASNVSASERMPAPPVNAPAPTLSAPDPVVAPAPAPTPAPMTPAPTTPPQ